MNPYTTHPRLLRGWRLEPKSLIAGVPVASDRDGFLWQDDAGRWKLRILGTKRTFGLPPQFSDDWAIVDSVTGPRDALLLENGSVSHNRRRIPSENQIQATSILPSL